MIIKIKEIYTSFLFFLIVMPFFIPDSVYSLDFFSHYLIIFSIWERCSVLIMLFCELVTFKKKYNLNDVYYYFGTRIFCATIIQLLLFSNISFSAIYRSIKTLMIICYIVKSFYYSYELTIKRLFYITAVLNIANFITIFLFPTGLYADDNLQNYLLGYKNGMPTLIFPAMCFAILYMNNTKKYVFSVLSLLAGGYSILATNSSTAIVGIIIFWIAFVLYKFPKIRKVILNWKTLLLVVATGFILINILQSRLNVLYFVASMFDKDISFTGRTDIWQAGLESFLHYPIFGVGENYDYLVNLFTVHVQKLSYAHNEILDVLVRYGIVGAFFYCQIIIKTVRNSQNIKNEMNALLPFFASMWMMMLFESYSNYSYYFLYFVILILPRIINEKERAISFSNLLVS